MFSIKQRPAQFTGGKKGTVRVRYSNYSFMFNTNKRPVTVTEAEQWDRVVNTALTRALDMEQFKGYITYLPHPEGRKNFTDIKRVKVRFQTEIGPTKVHGGRLHVHGLVEITHFGHIRLDYAKVQATANAEMAKMTGGRVEFPNCRWKVERVTPKQYLGKYSFGYDDGDIDVQLGSLHV
jgi:hypothetical protein